MATSKKRKAVKGPRTKAATRKPAVKAKPIVEKVPPPEGLRYSVELDKKGLPETLSGWIRSAVADAKKLDKTKGFRLDMGTFNSEFPAGVYGSRKCLTECHVCLGGAALVGRKLVAPGEGINGPETRNIAYALDYVRVGDLESAVRYMYEDADLGFRPSSELRGRLAKLSAPVATACRASSSGRAPWPVYLKLADRLEELGL
jgi:hypothetical protein